MFFFKAFIPGYGCDHTSHLSFANVDDVCSDSDSPSDGTTDAKVLPAPGITSEWFRGDARCHAPTGSYRLGSLCEIFKSGSSYKVKCSGNAGWTHHWKREGIFSGGCWYISCDKRDGFSGNYESQSFSSTTKYSMEMEAGNPCYFLAPRIKMDFQVEISISGGQTALKLTGSKSRFPAMEAYYQPSGASPMEWFYFDIGDRTVLSLMLPNADVNWDTRMFPCNGC